MPPSAAQVTDVDEGTVLNLMSLVLTLEALVAKLVVRPIPRTVDSFLNARNVAHVKGGCGGCEGAGDVATEATIGICVGKVVCGLGESEPLICELFSQLSNLARTADDLGVGGTVVDDFHTKSVITFLTHCPIDALGVGLVVSEEEFLTAIEGGVREGTHRCRCGGVWRGWDNLSHECPTTLGWWCSS